jgi:hypothetical protein
MQDNLILAAIAIVSTVTLIGVVAITIVSIPLHNSKQKLEGAKTV